jgi:hypothetical protein
MGTPVLFFCSNTFKKNHTHTKKNKLNTLQQYAEKGSPADIAVCSNTFKKKSTKKKQYNSTQRRARLRILRAATPHARRPWPPTVRTV